MSCALEWFGFVGLGDRLAVDQQSKRRRGTLGVDLAFEFDDTGYRFDLPTIGKLGQSNSLEQTARIARQRVARRHRTGDEQHRGDPRKAPAHAGGEPQGMATFHHVTSYPMRAVTLNLPSRKPLCAGLTRFTAAHGSAMVLP